MKAGKEWVMGAIVSKSLSWDLHSLNIVSRPSISSSVWSSARLLTNTRTSHAPMTGNCAALQRSRCISLTKPKINRIQVVPYHIAWDHHAQQNSEQDPRNAEFNHKEIMRRAWESLRQTQITEGEPGDEDKDCYFDPDDAL